MTGMEATGDQGFEQTVERGDVPIARAASPLWKWAFIGTMVTPLFEGHLQAIREEGHKDVRLNAVIALMEDRTDRQVPFQLLERLLNLGELDVVFPQRGRRFVAEIGAQQVAALAAAHLTQLLAVEHEREGLGGDRLIRLGQGDTQSVIGASGLFLGGTELDEESFCSTITSRWRSRSASSRWPVSPPSSAW
jgi:hypothetical protein